MKATVGALAQEYYTLTLPHAIGVIMGFGALVRA
jgi:hypothetical protein